MSADALSLAKEWDYNKNMYLYLDSEWYNITMFESSLPLLSSRFTILKVKLIKIPASVEYIIRGSLCF